MEIDLGNIYRKRAAESRSLSAENSTGEKGLGGMATEGRSLKNGFSGAARDLGRGWKASPCISLEPGQTATLMDNDGPGVIRHIWITLASQF